MSKSHLPQTTEKTSPPPPPQVPVAITEETVTDAEALKEMQAMGLVRVKEGTVRGLAKLGVYLKGAGTLKVQRGQALATQQRLDEASQILLEQMRPEETTTKDGKTKKKVKPVEDLVALAGGLSQLAKSINESQRLSVEVEGLVASTGGGSAEEPEAPTASFKPGQKVGPAAGATLVQAQSGSEVHLHMAPDKK